MFSLLFLYNVCLSFQNRSFSPTEVLTKAVSDAREWQAAQELAPLSQDTPHSLNNWEPCIQSLHPEIVTVHTDAAWKEADKRAGIAWIFSDNTGTMLAQGTSVEEFAPSPLVAEGMAIREALLQAQALGFTKLAINSDAQIIIRAINERGSIKEFFGILQDILNLSCYLSISSFNFIPRKDYMIADGLAKRALTTWNLYTLHFILIK